MSKRTTLSVRADRHMKLERVAINVSNKIKRTITWTDVTNYLIDNYSKEAEKDMEMNAKDL